jgi:3-dehydroquinate dehydratase-2
MRFLICNGPNLNLLGLREPEIYGKESYHDLETLVRNVGARENIAVDIFQSNHEGALVDAIQNARGHGDTPPYDGIVLNPAAYTQPASRYSTPSKPCKSRRWRSICPT